MAQAQQPHQSESGGGMGILWGIVAIGLLFGVIWYVAHDQIVHIVLKLKLYELKVASFVSPGLKNLELSLAAISPRNYSNIDFKDLMQYVEAVNKAIKYGVATILAILAIILYSSHTTLRYRKRYSMKKLAVQEAAEWPQIRPIIGLDLLKEPIDKGPWAMGLTPMQFAKKYRLLQELPPQVDEGTFEKKVALTATISKGAAYQVFAAQLGPVFQGISALPLHVQALFAIFAARIAGDRAGASSLVDQIAASVRIDSKDMGKVTAIDFSGVQSLLKKHQDHKKVQQILKQHTFVLTIMASLLVAARQDGVLATADFLWLKVVDRRLWFMLNTMGRKTPFTEVAGVFAHWQAELQFGKPIRIPMVEEAVNGLVLAMTEVVYVPDESEE